MEVNSSQISLAAIGEKAGVSAMTVSRVLRNTGNVAPSTCKKVRDACLALGYKPDPHMARLMARVRNRKSRSISASIAVVIDGDLTGPYNFVPLEAVQARADQHGYRAEAFCLGRDRLTVNRLRQVLISRGIEGVIALPSSSSDELLRFSFNDFSSVAFGYALKGLGLHRASTNMMQGVLGAINHLTDRGYLRIGLAVTEWVNQRADFAYTGALLHYQLFINSKDRVPPLLLPSISSDDGLNVFCQWVKKYRPDVIISFDRFVPEWISKELDLRIPDDIGLVVHDWLEGMDGLSGIDHRRSAVARAAVDLLATQLMHNEIGIPAVPQQILIPPRFVVGPSIR